MEDNPPILLCSFINKTNSQVEQIHRMNLCYRTHGCRQRINNKPIREECKIWVVVTEALVYVVQFRRAKKGKQVASSTKWGLGENLVLWLMECLTQAFSFDIFMDNCFTSFSLLTLLWATVVLNKKGYTIVLLLGTNSCNNKERGYFE